MLNYRYEAGAFSLANTLECGQCFRWKKDDDGSYLGVVGQKQLRIKQEGTIVTLYNTTEDDFISVWKNYFDFDTDYSAIYRDLCQDKIIKTAYEYAGEIHILRQDPWEGLCSFIISQNNNIPRIIGIIDRLCRKFGEEIDEGFFTFPSAERLAGVDLSDLSELRAGFRAKYILDAAQRVADGRVDFSRISSAEIGIARQELSQIFGVGPKVAECALLFGCYRLDAFPIDVWIKRVMDRYYRDGFPEFAKPYGGVAQQVLFHYMRCSEEAKNE